MSGSNKDQVKDGGSQSTTSPPGFSRHHTKCQSYAEVVSGRKVTEALQEGESPQSLPEIIATIFVGNLPKGISEEALHNFFHQFGKINAMMIHRKENGNTFAFILYSNKRGAEIAIMRMNGRTIGNRVLRINWAFRNLKGVLKKMSLTPRTPDDPKEEEEVQVVQSSLAMEESVKNSVLMVGTRKQNLEGTKEMLEALGIGIEHMARWGVQGVVARCKTEKDFSRWMEKREEIAQHFNMIEPMETFTREYKRFAWVECRGIPMEAWSKEGMDAAVAKWGNLVYMAKQTELLRRLDVAHLLICTKKKGDIEGWSTMEVNKVRYKVWVKEFFDASIIEEDEIFIKENSMGTRENEYNRSENTDENSLEENETVEVNKNSFEEVNEDAEIVEETQLNSVAVKKRKSPSKSSKKSKRENGPELFKFGAKIMARRDKSIKASDVKKKGAKGEKSIPKRICVDKEVGTSGGVIPDEERTMVKRAEKIGNDLGISTGDKNKGTDFSTLVKNMLDGLEGRKCNK